MGDRRAPQEVREGVRQALLASLRSDSELIAGRTARRLAAAGAIGVTGAVGATLLVTAHPFGQYPSWNVAVFSAIWAGLLVVSLSLMFLRIRTPGLPVGQSAAMAVLGLGVAGVVGLCAPDAHFLHWWTGTRVGGWTVSFAGIAGSTLCLGFLAAVFFGATAAAVLLHRRQPASALALAATMLFLLLLPGVALQSVGTSFEVFAAWALGTAIGCYVGVRAGASVRSKFRGPEAIRS